MLRVTCPGCAKSYRIAATAAGKRATCRQCGQRFSIPEATTGKDRVAPPPAASKSLRNSKTANTHELLQILDEAVDFPKQPVTVAHRFAALVVAGMMLVLPVIYVLFAAGVGGLTYWHITHDYVWVRSPMPTGGRFIVVSGLLYLGLTVGGILWTFSLIRPLFLRIGGSDGQLGLSRHDEPLLFAFTDLLADKVGAPRPQIIRLSFDANASASYDTSMFGLRRRAFMLTLGVPLIRGLTLAELAGVMAHEFGHFSQRSSSFLHRFITRINLWFVVAVHHPSAIDAMIESLTTTNGNSFLLNLAALVGWVVGILVRLGRSVLWCLMQLGILASASLSRRMEFDADCYHVGVIGSAAYPKACRRFMALVVAHEMALKYAFQTLQGRILPADLSSFVAELADRSPRVKQRARKMIEKQKSDWMASHPPMRERIAAAKQLNLPAAFASPIPGTVLLSSFEKQSAALTGFLYRHMYGSALPLDAIRPTHEAVDFYLDFTESNRRGLLAGKY